MTRTVPVRHALNALRRAPHRLGDLGGGDLVLLAAAPAALPVSAFLLRRLGLRSVQSLLPLGRGRMHRRTEAFEAERVAWIVKITAMYGPWAANCLQRSVVLWWYLRARGLDADLRIGVRRDPERGGLDFHAWVEHDGLVVNDRPDVRERYATFDRAVAPRDVTFR